MNLMDMVNGLNRMDDTNPFSPTAFLLAVKLLDLYNRLRWADSVAVDLERMRVMAKCSSRNTAIRARDELISRGVLVVVAKGKKGAPSCYRMNDLSQFGSFNELYPALYPAPNPALNPEPNPALYHALNSEPNPAPIYNTTYYKEKTIKDKTIKEEGNQRTRFTPPTVQEVADYAREKGLDISADRFVDFYASKGWKVGSTPMKDWQAAARNWASRDKSQPSAPAAKPAPKQVREQMYSQREYDDKPGDLPSWMKDKLQGLHT